MSKQVKKSQPKSPEEPSKAISAKPVDQKPQPRRGFFSLLFSHLMAATIAVIAVGAYLHWTDILKYTGSRVCAYDMLGQYGGQPPKVPPIDHKKPDAKKGQAKNQTKPQQQLAAEKPQAKSLPAALMSKSENKALEQAWQDARKLFWTNDKSAPAAYEKLVQDNPDSGELQAELGNVYFKIGERQKAIQMYEKAHKRFQKQQNTDRAGDVRRILQAIARKKSKKPVN